MKKTIWIVRTAVCLALLLVLQVATKSLGQFVTGSCVNLVLAMAALTGGVWSGVIVAVISPFCAYALGIGPAFLLFVPVCGAWQCGLCGAVCAAGRQIPDRTAPDCMGLHGVGGSGKGAGTVSGACEACRAHGRSGGKACSCHGGLYLAAAGYGPDWRRACLPACAGRKKGAGEAELIENSSGAVVTAPFFENNRFPRAA